MDLENFFAKDAKFLFKPVDWEILANAIIIQIFLYISLKFDVDLKL